MPDEWFTRKRTWAKQGWVVYEKNSTNRIRCHKCHEDFVVYNGNYFCDSWVYRKPREKLFPGECDWALPHPAVTAADRQICDLIGIDYY